MQPVAESNQTFDEFEAPAANPEFAYNAATRPDHYEENTEIGRPDGTFLGMTLVLSYCVINSLHSVHSCCSMNALISYKHYYHYHKYSNIYNDALFSEMDHDFDFDENQENLNGEIREEPHLSVRNMNTLADLELYYIAMKKICKPSNGVVGWQGPNFGKIKIKTPFYDVTGISKFCIKLQLHFLYLYFVLTVAMYTLKIL